MRTKDIIGSFQAKNTSRQTPRVSGLLLAKHSNSARVNMVSRPANRPDNDILPVPVVVVVVVVSLHQVFFISIPNQTVSTLDFASCH